MAMKLVNGEWQDVPDWFDGSGSEANLLGAKNDSPTGIYTFKDKNGYQWNIMNGVAMPFNSTGYFPTQDVVDMFTKNGIRVGTQQDVSNAINEDAPGNGAGKGSMKEGILSAIAAAAAMYGAGNMLGGTGGLDISGGLDMPGGVTLPDGLQYTAQGAGDGTSSFNVTDVPDFGVGSSDPWGAGTPNQSLSVGNLSTPQSLGYQGVGFDTNQVAQQLTPVDWAQTGSNGFDHILNGFQMSSGAGASTSSSGGKTALQRLLSGTATGSDYAELGLKALPGVLGAFGASQQSGKLGDLATQFQTFGGPSRARYEASFAPGFSMSQDPGFTDALNSASKSNLYALSTGGNPSLSPNAQQQNMADLYAKFSYPALQNYRNQNASTSGISSFNAAAPSAATGAVGSNAGVYNGIGSAIGSVVNPPQTLADILKQYQESNGGSSIFKVAA